MDGPHPLSSAPASDVGIALQREVAALAPRIRAEAPAIDRDRHVPEELVEALRRAGAFRVCVPRAYGGDEIPASDLVGVIVALARSDASTAWVTMIGSTTHILSAYLPERGAAEVYADGVDGLMGGLISPPSGRAVRVPGGYRVTGRWPYASASRHCDWFVARCEVVEPARDAPGGTDGAGAPAPDTRILFLPAADVRIHDTWHVAGLRGTGSHDYETTDTFVPDHRSFSLYGGEATQRGPLYTLGNHGLLPGYLAAVTIGLGYAAIDAYRAHASGTRVRGTPLSELPLARVRVAEAMALVRSAEAYVLRAIRSAWAAHRPDADPDADPDPSVDADLWLSGTHAAHACADAVERMYTAGGASALRSDSPLQRHLRDVHAAKQHVVIGFGVYERVGAMVLATEA